jgi:hypothetical protein
MKIVYLAGSYRGRSRWRVIRWLQVWRNLARAWLWAYRLNSVGYFVFSPHLNSAPVGWAATAEHWLQGDLALIIGLCYGARREFVLATLPGSDKSTGTQNEIACAHTHGSATTTARALWLKGKRRG